MPGRAIGIAYEYDAPPKTGRSSAITATVDWVQMPLPFSLNHVNVYVLRGDERHLIVDCGLKTPETLAAWAELLGPDGDLATAKPRDVLVTHMHPDHSGCAAWLLQRSTGRLYIAKEEHSALTTFLQRMAEPASELETRFFKRAGWSEAQLSCLAERWRDIEQRLAPLPAHYTALHDRERLVAGGYEWEVVIGSGHSEAHACLYSQSSKLLISGDQVLPRISSNVSVHPAEPASDPMRKWLASLATIRARVPDDVLVLPAHGLPFRGLHGRLQELERQQQTAFDQLKTGLSVPHRATETFQYLFKRAIDDGTREIATGEAIACLNHLLLRSEIDVHDDSEGVAWYWRRTAAAVQSAALQ